MTWIPVSERLPGAGDNNGQFIVYDTHYPKYPCVAAARFYDGRWYDPAGDGDDQFYGVTHWQPLPEPPGKD